MKKRSSFIIHFDSLSVLDELDDDQAGKLFKAIKALHLEEDIELDPLTKIALNPFKNQFARDDIKYQEMCERNKKIAMDRHAKKSTSRNKSKRNVTKSTDNDSDSDSDSKSDSDKQLIIPDGINQNAWNEWVNYRKDKKKPVSKAAAVKQFKVLLKYKLDEQQLVINQSIQNDYQGLFELKVNRNENTQRYVSGKSPAQEAAEAIQAEFGTREFS